MFAAINIQLIQAHAFTRQTSKSRSVPALINGVCEQCSQTINAGDQIVWHRKLGAFHAARNCNPFILKSGSSLDAAGVTKMIEQALENFEAPAPTASVDDERLAELVRIAVEKQKPSVRELHVKMDEKSSKIVKLKNPHAQLELSLIHI